MSMLNRWLDRIMNATKSEDAYIARDTIRNMFQDKDDRIEELENLMNKWGVKECSNGHERASWQMGKRAPKECPFCTIQRVRELPRYDMKDGRRVDNPKGRHVDALSLLKALENSE